MQHNEVYCFCFGTGSTIIAMQAAPNPAHYYFYPNLPEKPLAKGGTMAQLDDTFYTCDRAM
jgi:cytochrome c oxidase assembly protein Cox11